MVNHELVRGLPRASVPSGGLLSTTILSPLSSLPLPTFSQLLADVETERATSYNRAARSSRTRDEYARDWADFEAYCQSRGLSALPGDPRTVARYVASLGARLKISTIRRRVVSISQVHQERGLEPPTRHKIVREVITGIANTHGGAPQKKSALTLDLLHAAILVIDDATLKGTRDRALLLLGFAGALRRSELAALDVADLAFDRRGLTVTLRRSKTDQGGSGREIAISSVDVAALCPVRALRRWLDAAQIAEGPVFRTFALPRGRRNTASDTLKSQRIDGRDVARILQRVTMRAHVDGDFAAHSLRAGFITSAAQKKIPEVDIQRITGHRSVAVLRGYVRCATIFEDAPLSTIMSDN